MIVEKIDHVMICVRNLDEATAFVALKVSSYHEIAASLSRDAPRIS